MVEILCPHCEEEIELEDGASGDFECPYCEEEFEWNVKPKSKPKSIRISSHDSDEFEDIPMVPVVAGVAFCLWMGWIIIGSIYTMYIGMTLSSLESEYGSGTSFGAFIIISSLVAMGFGGAGIFFGVNAARRNLTSLMVITGMSGAIFILGLFFLDVQLLVISGVFIAANLVLLNVPKLKYQFL
tara:strand:- start:339 stop:890 length:552 start_codon:yes stop_codon:yes gene_type:complete